jgi:hypothetical protein
MADPPHWADILKSLQVEKNKLAQQAAMQQQPPKVPEFVPSFAYEHSLRNFDATWTLTGLLWVRLSRHIKPTQFGDAPSQPKPIKFAVGGVGIIDAIEAKQDGNPAIAVVVMHKDTAMILHDDPGLFPSDALITKIITLKDT